MGEGRNPPNRDREQRGPLGREEIERNLRLVGRHLHEQGLVGEILLTGGAYMTLVLRQREATKDVDAYFAANAQAVREAAARVAREEGLPAHWLNDAVKGFIYTEPDATLWLECPGLRVYAPHPSYIFAMKAVAGRPEDMADLRALRDTLGLTSAAEALSIVSRYVPERLLTPRVQYLIEGLFDEEEDA
ncbi:MAG: DUF6036 family nucleotidyltransferase [Chloroflexota bacterium]